MMIGVQEAERLLRAHVHERGAEWCDLERAAGRILRQDLVSDRPLPACDRVAMDGIAISTVAVRAGIRRFRVEARQPAGVPAGALREVAGCVEVMTGTPLPLGADCVVQVEDVEIADGWAQLRTHAPVQPLQNVQPCGSERAAGASIARAGARLTSPLVAAAAGAGHARVRVSEVPRIAVVSTGDEVVPVADSPAAHQVRGANGPALQAALSGAGFTDVVTRHIRDDAAALGAGLESLLRDCDVLVVSGGVSAGAYDLVPGTLAALGAVCHFHRIRQKPGKPFWFGTANGGATPVFALPGNPVSALVCLHRYVLPALLRACGAQATSASASLAAVVTGRADLTLFLPVRLDTSAGRLDAHVLPLGGSGDIAGLAPSHGFVEIPEGGAAAGAVVPLWAWS